MRIRPMKLAAGVGVAALLVFATACGSSGGGADGSKATKTTSGTTKAASKGWPSAAGVITIKGFAFDPEKVTAEVGQEITVRNEGSTAHTVTADDGDFDTRSIPAHGTATFTVTKAGMYPFHCAIHEHMKGTLTVS